jgi:hypothetical protein
MFFFTSTQLNSRQQQQHNNGIGGSWHDAGRRWSSSPADERTEGAPLKVRSEDVVVTSFKDDSAEPAEDAQLPALAD